MKHMKQNLATLGIALSVVLISACSDRNNASDSDAATNTDTNAMDTRRNATDTSNYLTKDSGNQSQDVVDPNPPTNGRN
jgi:hypothetical protein